MIHKGVARVHTDTILFLIVAVVFFYVFGLIYVRKTRENNCLLIINDREAGDEFILSLSDESICTMEWMLSGFSIALLIAFVSPTWLIAFVALFFLLVSSYYDLKYQVVGDIFTVPILVCGIAYGCREGHFIIACAAAVIACIYDITLSDSKYFGGADVIAWLGSLAFFGVCSWFIVVAVSCIFAIILKLILWATKLNKMSDHGLPYIPALTAGNVVIFYIDRSYGHLFAISFSDALWAFQNIILGG